ncbi:MAG: Tm-1-like ATP-binding domain-containing protein, partial [Pirellulaceae bacterium]
LAQLAGIDLAAITRVQDRGQAMAAMVQAAPRMLASLHEQGRIDGVIALGGGGGTAIAAAAMRVLPIGFPKLIVSTMASGNTAHYLGTKDIAMIPSVVDIQGLNRVSRLIFSRAAGAIVGMVRAESDVASGKPLIVASMFGNTTPCVQHAKKVLEGA